MSGDNRDDEQWRGLFEVLADRVVSLTGAGRILDVGCAKGLLVQALREKGADAEGFDISEQAIASAHSDVRPHLWVATAADPIEKKYDLITCMEVVEHLAPDEAQRVIDRITGATDRVLFVSSPRDHEPTRDDTSPSATWAAWFAERGFHRRTDVDLTFLSPWAVVFERDEPTSRDLVQRYERLLADVTAELLEKRRDSSEHEAEVLEARHSLLVNRDHVIGTEAEIGRLNLEVGRLADELKRATKRVTALSRRKNDLARRVDELRERVATVRERNKALSRRVAELEQRSANRATFARRVARRLRRG